MPQILLRKIRPKVAYQNVGLKSARWNAVLVFDTHAEIHPFDQGKPSVDVPHRVRVLSDCAVKGSHAGWALLRSQALSALGARQP